MTRFSDGPAAGHTLRLRRAPIYLRVTRDPAGGIDALDQAGDRPCPDEALFAYRQQSYDGSVHINSWDSQGRRTGGFFPMATYALIDPQPDEATMRSLASWQEWTEADYDRRRAEAR